MGNSLFLERLNDNWAEEYEQGTLLGQGCNCQKICFMQVG